MFQHSERGTLVWLFIVGMALGLTLLTSEVSLGFSAALLAAYLGLVFMIVRGANIGYLIEQLRTQTEQLPASTEVAREAAARARGYHNYDSLVHLVDIGLIVDEQRPDGMALRRGRIISLDDDAIRPFVVIHIPEILGERLSHIRFELRDGNDKLRYAFEDERWLQSGENTLLPDYRFPVRKKAGDIEAGGWSARIIIDEGLIGVYHFNMQAGLSSRRERIGADGEIMRERVWRDEDEALPVSLEELLRQQSRQQYRNG